MVERSMSRCRTETSRSCASTAPVCTQFRTSAAWVSFTSVSWSASVPLRRPASRSLANGGPPTFIRAGEPAPTSTERSGFRARNVNELGAFATCSRTNPRSNRTRASSTVSPAPARSARAPSCRTSSPISSRIRIAVSCTRSSCSSSSTLGACSGPNIGGLPLDQGRQQVVERTETGVMHLERPVEPGGDRSGLLLPLGFRVLPDEQHPRDMAEVFPPQPREPVEAEPVHDRALPVVDEPVRQDVDPGLVTELPSELAGVPAEAVHAGGPDDVRVALEHRVEPAARAAIRIQHDHARVAPNEAGQPGLDPRGDVERGHVQLARDPVHVGVPPVSPDEPAHVEGERAAGEEREAPAGGLSPPNPLALHA